MKKASLVILFFACLLLSGCQNAQFSDVREKATEVPADSPKQLPTANPEADWKEMLAYYKNAEEREGLSVQFSAEDGFCTKSFSLSLTAEGASDIFYTDDGSVPGPSSIHYTRPIELTVTDAELPRCAVIRAVAYYTNGTKSPVFTHTYFLNANMKKRFTTPVFSIIASPDELTYGPDALLVGKRALDTGEYAKRTVLMQLFLTDGTEALCQPATLRVYGDSSRNTAVKSLQLIAGTGEEEEEQLFRYSFFGTSNVRGEPMDRYQDLVLSSSEADFQYAFIRDEFAQTLAKQADFQDYEDVLPVVVYINGSYYGLHWMHENYSNEFFQTVYGAFEGRYAVVSWTAESGASALEQTDNEAAVQFQAAYEQLLTADLQTSEGLAFLRQFMDVENYLDWCALNILIDNVSWPSQMEAYACIPADGDVKDAQWRFLPHAMSSSFGLKDGNDAASKDTLGEALNPKSARYAPLFAKLMKVQEYRSYFVEKVTELLGERWSKDAMLSTLKELHNTRNSEMKHYLTQIETLRKTRNSGVWMKKKDFETTYSNLTNYVKARPDAVMRQLEQHFPQKH